MLCKMCSIKMVKRSGKFGDFYFCPNQQSCGQKTISASNNPPASRVGGDVIKASNDSLVYEMRILEAEAGPLFSGGSCGDFVNDHGEPVNYDGELMYGEGDWFRPY